MQEQLIDSDLPAGEIQSPANQTVLPLAPPRKLRGGSRAEMSWLKSRWRKLPGDERAGWRELLRSHRTRAEIRTELRAKLRIHLRHDAQINDFRAWEREQHEQDLQSGRRKEDARRAAQLYPDGSLAGARELVLRQACQRACVHGDFKLGLAALRQDISVQAFTFTQAKHLEHQRTKLQAGLAELGQVLHDNSATGKLCESLRGLVQGPTQADRNDT